MYLPTFLYKRAPLFWLFIGALLIILGVYLGLEMNRNFLYVGVPLGIGSCLWGLRVMMKRNHPPESVKILDPTAPVE